nr:PREDICTED: uncharacterized protein LOC109040665 [Bemisia tabaci]
MASKTFKCGIKASKCANYARITKMDTFYDKIKKSIFLRCKDLGRGTSAPVAYDTGWVARIPDVDLMNPAFPLCSQWLRDHQNQDGSWGDCSLACNGVMNTLSAVLGLSQWKHPDDAYRIKKGINAVHNLAGRLPSEVTPSFDLLIARLIEEALELRLDFPYGDFERFRENGRKELKKIENILLTNRPTKLWAFLEASGSKFNLDLEYYRQEIVDNGLIGVQPSTTAFLLRQARMEGRNFPEAEWVLEKLVIDNNGGIPHVVFPEEFEIIFGLQFLFAAGIDFRKNLEHGVTKRVVEKCMQKLNLFDSARFSLESIFPDEFCEASSRAMLKRFFKEEFDDGSGTTREKAEAGDLTTCYELADSDWLKERIFLDRLTGKDCAHRDSMINRIFESKEVDKKELLPIDTYSDRPPVDQTEKNSSEFLSPNKIDGSLLRPLKNISKFFKAMQLVLYSPSPSNRHDVACLLTSSQNKDGGWGSKDSSNGEETAYASLALFSMFRQNADILNKIDFPKLVQFMTNVDVPLARCSWSFKVNFQSPALTELAWSTAKYAVFQMESLYTMTVIVNEEKLDTSEIDIFAPTPNTTFLPIFTGVMLRLKPEPQLEDIAIDKQAMMQAVTDAVFGGELPSTYIQSLIEVSLVFSSCIHPVKLSMLERMVETLLCTAVFILDDITDLHLPGKRGFEDSQRNLYNLTIDILEGKTREQNLEAPVDFPNSECVVKMLSHFRHFAEQRGSEVSYLVEEWFKNFGEVSMATYRDMCRSIAPTTERYLQLQSVGSGLMFLTELSCLVEGLAGSREFKKSTVCKKYFASANKAARLGLDIGSVMKDVGESTLENYCLRLENEFGMSLNESLEMATNEYNKEVLNMFMLKKIMLQDSTLKDDKELAKYLQVLESVLDGLLEWSFDTSRYKTEWTYTITRCEHQNRTLEYVQKLCFSHEQLITYHIEKKSYCTLRETFDRT